MVEEFKWSEDPYIRGQQYLNEAKAIENLLSDSRINPAQYREMMHCLNEDYKHHDGPVPAVTELPDEDKPF